MCGSSFWCEICSKFAGLSGSWCVFFCLIARVTASSSSSFDVGVQFLIWRVQFYHDGVPWLSRGIFEYFVRIH